MNFHGYRNGVDTGCTAMVTNAITLTVGNCVLYLVRVEVTKGIFIGKNTYQGRTLEGLAN
jgi:hypothetical protein